MTHFRFSQAENRLLNVSIDPNAVKYNRRNAEINAANQQAQRTAQVAASQALPRETYIDPSTGKDSRIIGGGDTSQKYYDDKGNVTFDITTTGLPSAQSGGQLFNKQGGQFADPVKGVPKQQLNQSGNQIFDATTGKTTMISGAMGQTGAQGYNPAGVLGKKSVADTVKSAGDAADAELVRGNYLDPAQRQKARQEAEANALKTAELEQKERDAKVTKESNKAGTDPVTETDNPSAGLLALLSPEEKTFFEGFMNDQNSATSKALAENKANMAAYLNGGTVDGVEVEGLNQVREAIKKDLDDAKAIRETFKAETEASLKEDREETRRMIDEEKGAQTQRLQWDKDKLDRDIAKQKTAAHESLIVQYALGGGFGQMAAMADVRASDATFDQRLQDVQTEFGVQRTELSAKFTGLYLKNDHEYRAASRKNAEDAMSALERLNTQGQQNTISFMNAQNAILEKHGAEQTRLTEKKASDRYALAKEMMGMISKNKEEGAKAQESSYKTVLDAFTKFPAGSTERKTAIALYKAAGGKVDFNENTKTIEEINKASDNASGSFISDNVGKYRDATTGDDLAIVISSVISGKGIATADERTGRRNDLMALLQGGEATREEFNQLLMNTAYIALDTTERNQVDSKTQVSEAITRVREKISNLTPEQTAKMGFWAKKYKGVANFMDVKNDPEFVKMMTDITYPMASLRKELFGSALTDSELAFSDVFLANPMAEDIKDSFEKMGSISEQLEHDVSSLYSHRLGSKEFYDVLKKDGVMPTSSPEIKDWNQTIQQSTDGNTSGSGGLLEPLADAHIKHEGYGTQGAKTITANNNPGALRWSPSQETFGGVKPGGTKPDGTKNEGGFTWFPDYDSGRKALIADLNAKISGKSRHIDYSKDPTLFDYISVYAPVGDRNNPSSYAKAIVSDLVAAGYDVNINTPLSELKKLIV